MVNYYDGMLGGIGTLLVAGVVAAAFIGYGAVAVASLGAMALLAHAMFVRPPMRTESASENVQPVAAD